MGHNSGNFTIKQGDLEPAISAVLKDHDGDIVNLTGATSVLFQFKRMAGGAALQSGAATIDDATAGAVSYSWTSGDTNTVGTYQAEFVVTWPTSREQTFPSSGYIVFRIEADLD